MTDQPLAASALREQLIEFAEKFAEVGGYDSLVRVLRAAADALAPPAEPSTATKRYSIEDIDQIVAAITAVVREADEGFQKSGGTSRHWARDWFLPLLYQHGWRLEKDEPAPPGASAPPAEPDPRVTDWHEIQGLKLRISKLEDAAFHFQTCRTCRKEGDSRCPDGIRFAAYLRGEAVLDGD